MRIKWQQLTILILAVVLVVGGGCWWINKGDKEEIVSLDEMEVVVDEEVEMSDWKEYQKKKIGYSLKYPPTWEIRNSEQDEEIVIWQPNSNDSIQFHLPNYDTLFLKENAENMTVPEGKIYYLGDVDSLTGPNLEALIVSDRIEFGVVYYVFDNTDEKRKKDNKLFKKILSTIEFY